MTSKKKDTFDSNAVQNRFTAYLITAIRRKKTDYWKKTEHVRTHELIVDTDEVFEDGETSYENVMNIGGEIQNERSLRVNHMRFTFRQSMVSKEPLTCKWGVHYALFVIDCRL